mgnify:CR=1 FL=1
MVFFWNRLPTVLKNCGKTTAEIFSNQRIHLARWPRDCTPFLHIHYSDAYRHMHNRYANWIQLTGWVSDSNLAKLGLNWMSIVLKFLHRQQLKFELICIYVNSCKNSIFHALMRNIGCHSWQWGIVYSLLCTYQFCWSLPCSHALPDQMVSRVWPARSETGFKFSIFDMKCTHSEVSQIKKCHCQIKLI